MKNKDKSKLNGSPTNLSKLIAEKLNELNGVKFDKYGSIYDEL